jgi:putative NADH-flavin reductase
MRLLIFGATGGTGQELVRQGLERGHEIAAFVRRPEKLTVRDPRLRVIQGDISKPETVRSAIPGNDAVLSALGSRDLKPSTLLSDAAEVIVRTMESTGVRRLLWESSLGIGQTHGQLGPLYNWFLIPLLLRNVFRDKERQESIIRSSNVDWTIVQPAALTNGPRTGSYRVGFDACAGRMFPKISRADVADFMLREAVENAHVRESVALCY